MNRPLVIAVDGTSGSGKSSTSRGVATALGLRYLDTGAQFRAMTWWLLQRGVDVSDQEAVVHELARRGGSPDVVSGTDPAAPTITIEGTDVSEAIRSAEVTGSVSPVSAVPLVRSVLLELQRSIIAEAATDDAADSAGAGIVVEGRDIGTVVWPDAAVKVYLTADTSARAARRAAEEGGSDVGRTAASLQARDRIDSGRATAPLAMADDAVAVDSTDLTLEEVIDRIVAQARAVR